MRLLVEGESDEGVVVVISEGAARVASEVAAVVAGVMALAGGVASVNDAIDVEVARARRSVHGGCQAEQPRARLVALRSNSPRMRWWLLA
jgi:hypothetical protein